MPQCIVLNVTDRDEWIDQDEHPNRKRAIGLHVPAKDRPTLVHHTREDAEREAARLACTSAHGYADTYAVFELVAVVKGKVLADTDRVQGMGTCKALVPKWDDTQGGKGMSREAFGDPPESQEPPDLCPVCGNDWHAEDCVFGKEVARRLKAERDAHKLAHENEQLRRLSSLDAMRAGKLAEDVERYSALHARLFAEKTAAQIDAENMRELLYRMLEAPTTQISPSWKEEIRPALVAPGCKTPDGCRENGCLGWCDEHKPEGPKP